MLFDRYIVKLARLAAESLPRGEEVETQAEAGLEDDEALAPGLAPLDFVALQKNEAGLRGAAGLAVIDVAEGLRVRRALLEMQRCGLDRGRHRPSISA